MDILGFLMNWLPGILQVFGAGQQGEFDKEARDQMFKNLSDASMDQFRLRSVGPQMLHNINTMASQDSANLANNFASNWQNAMLGEHGPQLQRANVRSYMQPFDPTGGTAGLTDWMGQNVPWWSQPAFEGDRQAEIRQGSMDAAAAVKPPAEPKSGPRVVKRGRGRQQRIPRRIRGL